MRFARFTLPLILLFGGWQQPVPTYSIHITGEAGDVVYVSGCDEQPDGTVTVIKRTRMLLSVHFYINADHHLRLKVETETPIEAQVFYEDKNVKQWLATAKGIKDVPITFDIPAR